MIYNTDCLLKMKELDDNSIDIIFADPPYNLGTEWTIKNGAVVVKRKAVDFMAKWEGLDENFLNEFFSQAQRILKKGGRCLMFGMDRQLLPFQYYATKNEFEQKQNLYWFFISNFPKATDLSKAIDKRGKKNQVYAQQFQDFREYLRKGLKKANKTQASINKLIGSEMATHYFGNAQPSIPTAKHYKKIKKYLNLDDRYDELIRREIKENTPAEREVVGKGTAGFGKGRTYGMLQDGNNSKADKEIDITTPKTPLAQKYDGLKYSISPLKQVLETIMVFQKPLGKSVVDSVIDDLDDETLPTMDIENNRVGFASDKDKEVACSERPNHQSYEYKGTVFPDKRAGQKRGDTKGRYPSQLYCDTQSAVILDRQSGDLTSNTGGNSGTTFGSGMARTDKRVGHKDTGGASKILHKCDYDKDEYDLLHYQPKVSQSERNAGCGSLDKKPHKTMRDGKSNPLMDKFITEPKQNNHPTLKPQALIEKIFRLLLTPDKQTVFLPFAGAGSEYIGCYNAGYRDIIATELSPEYYEIAKARIKHNQRQGSLF